MIDRATVLAGVTAALRDVLDDPARDVQPSHFLVGDFGLDSAAIASLTIALETQFDDVLLLNEWIATADSPSDLTVASLVDYLTAVLSDAR